MDPQLTEIKDVLKRIEALVKSASSTTPSAGSTRTPVNRRTKSSDPILAAAASIQDLDDASTTLNKTFLGLNKTVLNTRKYFIGLNQDMRKGGRGARSMPAPAGAAAGSTKTGSGAAGGGGQGAAAGAAAAVLGDATTKTGKILGILSTSFESLKGMIGGVATDFLYLQKRGIDASSALGGLYLDAISSGMSLQEYNEMLERAGPAVTRSLNFDDFRKKISPTVDALGGLGVFGRQANELAGTMAAGSTMLGIPQQQLSGAMVGQVKMFEELRKTTAMTAEGFRALVEDLNANENVQSELLGMAPAQRAARQQELLQIGTLGARMGLTEHASKQLTEAILAQRKATAPQRFQQAGLVRQAGALAGMSSTETEELATLAKKKNKTAPEAERAAQLAGRLEQGIQKMQNSGQIGSEYIGEQLEEKLGGVPIGQLMKAGGAMVQAKESGPAGVNEKFGKDVGKFGQFVQKLITWGTGLGANPISGALLSVGGTITSSVVSGLTQGAVMKLLPGAIGGGAAGAAGAAGGLAGAAASAGTVLKGMASSVIGFSSSLLTSAKGLLSLSSITKAVTTTASTLKGAGPLLMGGLRALTAPLTLVTGAIFGFVEEAFTGEMANALGMGDGIFGRILGASIAGFNGVLTGITRLFDGAMNWVFGLFGSSITVNTTKFVDFATSHLVDAFKTMYRGVLKGLRWLITSLPFVGDDNYFVKKIDGGIASLDESLAESSKNREEMMNTEGATLRTIGEKNIKQQEEIAKRTAAASSEVLTSTENLTSKLIADAQRIRPPEVKKEKEKAEPENKPVIAAEAAKKEATPVSTSAKDVEMQADMQAEMANAEATAMLRNRAVATPTSQPAKTISQPDVNKTEVQAKEQTTASAMVAQSPALEPQDMVTILQQMLDVMKQQLEVSTVSADATDQMTKALKRSGFSDNVQTFDRARRAV